jgi:hypothetical protein
MDKQKKLYYQLSDGADASNIVMELSGCMAWIEGEQPKTEAEETEDRQYTLTPIWLTDRQFKKLPEANI